MRHRFNDPGATAVNGSGQSVPVTVSYTGSFNPDAPAEGTYTATYTATEDTNSTSTTRTIVVSDSEAPAITVDGANPYKIQQGSCSPFIDPGATAQDSCAGAKPVTSSTAGPGGASNQMFLHSHLYGYGRIASTDGYYSLVGTFNEDEETSRLPNQPPTVTLNGDDNQHRVRHSTQIRVLRPPSVATDFSDHRRNGRRSYARHLPITYSATANGHTTTCDSDGRADNTAPTIL
jgi:hypothetical protein